MNTITRRAFLRSVESMALLGIINGLQAPASATTKSAVIGTLNVVLHGLFIVNIADDKIELFPPYVHDHSYRLGHWDYSRTFPLKRCMSYKLKINNLPQLPSPALPSSCPILSQSFYDFTVHKEASYCAITLPFPNAINGLRSIYKGPITRDNNILYIRSYSLCIVLTYDAVDLHGLYLAGSGWYPVQQRGLQHKVVNLHIWAEPEKFVNPLHSFKAYEQLSYLVSPLVLKVITEQTAVLDREESPSIYGLPAEQEQGLAEWSSHGEGTRPRDCCSVITKS